jgi:hypothetical protein
MKQKKKTTKKLPEPISWETNLGRDLGPIDILRYDGKWMVYLKRLPTRIPKGMHLVHNTVLPTRRLGFRGFRAWLTPHEERLERCDCGWAPELGVHYRVRNAFLANATDTGI